MFHQQMIFKKLKASKLLSIFVNGPSNATPLTVTADLVNSAIESLSLEIENHLKDSVSSSTLLYDIY